MSTRRSGVRRNNYNDNRNNRTRSRRNNFKASLKRNNRRVRSRQANIQLDKYKKENVFLNEFYESQQSVMQQWYHTIRGGQALKAILIARKELRKGNFLTASIFFVLATSIAGIYSPKMGTTTGFDGTKTSRLPVANMNSLLEYHYDGIILPKVRNDSTYKKFIQEEELQEEQQRRCPPNLPNCNILGGGQEIIQKWKAGDFITNGDRFYKIWNATPHQNGDLIYTVQRLNGQNERDGYWKDEDGYPDIFSVTYTSAFNYGYRKVAFSAGGRRRRRRRKKKTRKKRGGMDNSEKKTNEITPRNSPSFVPPLQLPPPMFQSTLPSDVWDFINNHFDQSRKAYLFDMIVTFLNRGVPMNEVDNWLYQVYNSFLQQRQQQQGGHPGVFTKQADDLRKMSLDRWNRTPISTNEERVREATRRQKKGYAPPPFTSPLERQKSLNIEGNNAFRGGKKSKKIKEMIKIFQQYPDIFPSGYFRFLGARLENHLKKKTIIFKQGIILTWIKYQKTVKKSEECIYKPGDVKLDQIVNSNPGNGKAKTIMLKFLKDNRKKTIWLEVKKDNKTGMVVDTPSNRGMINKISDMLEILEN